MWWNYEPKPSWSMLLNWLIKRRHRRLRASLGCKQEIWRRGRSRRWRTRWQGRRAIQSTSPQCYDRSSQWRRAKSRREPRRMQRPKMWLFSSLMPPSRRLRTTIHRSTPSPSIPLSWSLLHFFYSLYSRHLCLWSKSPLFNLHIGCFPAQLSTTDTEDILCLEKNCK